MSERTEDGSGIGARALAIEIIVSIVTSFMVASILTIIWAGLDRLFGNSTNYSDFWWGAAVGAITFAIKGPKKTETGHKS